MEQEELNIEYLRAALESLHGAISLINRAVSPTGADEVIQELLANAQRAINDIKY